SVWRHFEAPPPWAPPSPLLDFGQSPRPLVSAAAWLALTGAGALAWWLARRRRASLLPFALLFLPLVPAAAASLVESGARFAERALALPMAGLALAAVELAAGPPRPRRLLAASALAAWLLAQTAVVWPAVAAWRDEESRIRRIASVRPHDLDAVLGMADLLSSQGRAPEAQSWLDRAEAL